MRYKAFISYRHLPKDQFVAETLHKALETFKLPKSLYDKCSEHTINRVFRDRDELPLSSNLSDSIQAAIAESEFLIVICSPQLKESRWCLEEIESFKTLHGREKIFAVLVEGEPEDSFPDSLLYEEYEAIDENGNKTKYRKPIEPLAADVRGKDFKEIKKLIKEESLRLIAPMLGLNYDDLKQRHRERKIKKIVTYSAIIGAVFLIFGIVSTSMAIAINRQNIEIKKNYSESLAEESERLFAEGNLYPAREKADLAVDYSASDKALAALDMAYGKSAAFGYHVLTDCYSMEDGVIGLEMSPDCQYLAMSDGLSQTILLDIATGEKEILKGKATSFLNGYFGFISDNKLIYNSSDGVVIYDPASKKEEIISPNFSMIIISDDHSLFALSDPFGRLSIYDSSTLNCLFDKDMGVTAGCVGDFSEDNAVYATAVSADDVFDGDVTVLKISDGQTIAQNHFDGGCPISIACNNEGYALSLCDISREDELSDNYVRSYDLSGIKKWESPIETFITPYVDYCGTNDSKLFTYQQNKVIVYDSASGEKIDEKPISGNLIICKKEKPGNYILGLSESNILRYSEEKGAVTTVVNYDVFPTLGLAEAVVDGDTLYAHFAGANYVSVYSVPEGSVATVLSDNAEDYLNNAPENVIIFQEALQNLYAYDVNFVRPESELMSLTIYSRDKKLCACYGDGKSVRVYGNGDTDPLYTLPINTGTVNYLMFSEDSGWFAASYQNGDVEIYDALTGNPVKALKKDFPYVFDIINLPSENTVIIDCAYDTKILDSDFNLRTTYTKSNDSMCIGFNTEDNSLLLRTGNEVKAVSLK